MLSDDAWTLSGSESFGAESFLAALLRELEKPWVEVAVAGPELS